MYIKWWNGTKNFKCRTFPRCYNDIRFERGRGIFETQTTETPFTFATTLGF